MKFIDLFAGIGGFHVGLSRLGHQCVFASEIKESLALMYEQNFGIRPNRDIRTIKTSNIPEHDILCAGFPCQPFSKAGRQKGLKDENNGNLFLEILRILRHHKPKYFILENVQNLATHDNQETYKFMHAALRKLRYDVSGEILSPHDYGIPQHRQRLFIIGARKDIGIDHFTWPKKLSLEPSVHNFLQPAANAISLEPERARCLEIWQELVDRIPKDEKLPSFPIWAMEFGATYPFEDTTPFVSSSSALGKYHGNFGIPLAGMDREEKFQHLPAYARTEEDLFPSWKRHYIRSNRAFYEKHKGRLQFVVKKIESLGLPSWQKLEWNIQGGDRDVSHYIIQFRGSGIRLKRPDFFPSLVCNSTQIPIIGWQQRYITRQEGAMLQDMQELKYLPENTASCFDALGNAVNARIVQLIAGELLNAKPTPHIMPSERASVMLQAETTISKTA